MLRAFVVAGLLASCAVSACYAGTIAADTDDANLAFALQSDGTVWYWGSVNAGQTQVLPNPPLFSGLLRGFGLQSNGNIWDLSYDSGTPPVLVQNVPGVSAIARTSVSALALKSDGTLWGWGDNSNGQLGVGAASNPVPVAAKAVALSNVVSVAMTSWTSFYASLAVKSDGTVWAWGTNYGGQFGNGQSCNPCVPQATPTQVGGLAGFTAISAGAWTVIALKSDGTVWTWGNPTRYKYLDAGAIVPSPVQVSGLSNIVKIRAGGQHFLALRNDGTLWSWGRNDLGQLGDGTTTSRQLPALVPGVTGPTQMGAGYDFSQIERPDGLVYAWGAGYAMGQGTNGAPQLTPIRVLAPGEYVPPRTSVSVPSLPEWAELAFMVLLAGLVVARQAPKRA